VCTPSLISVNPVIHFPSFPINCCPATESLLACAHGWLYNVVDKKPLREWLLVLVLWLMLCLLLIVCITLQRRQQQANGPDAPPGSNASNWTRNSRQQGWGGEPLTNSHSTPEAGLVSENEIDCA
jgi:hypothetical protein